MPKNSSAILTTASTSKRGVCSSTVRIVLTFVLFCASLRHNPAAMTQLISTIAVAMGASWVSGINLYPPVATLGLLSRFAHLRLPGELEVLTSWWVIGVAVILYLIEFFADKIPIVDSTWDVIHTFIRVPAGAVLAASAFGDFDRSIQVIALLLGGGLALRSHGTKADTQSVVQ